MAVAAIAAFWPVSATDPICCAVALIASRRYVNHRNHVSDTWFFVFASSNGTRFGT